MKTLVKIAALATGITAMTACSWFSNNPDPLIDDKGPQIDATLKASEIDSSKIDTSMVGTEKDTTIQASK